MSRIKLLDKNLINQIAAGEVIERPASVVKELIENSIDAGATKIEITVTNDCRNIRIADNGCGINPDDIELAFSKHATSKISTLDDLIGLSTLGFRGEALASLISVAKVKCITKQKNAEFGTCAVCENSTVEKSPTGCANGTTMEIEDLFYNIPARLKFLRSEKSEYAYITELVQAIALSHPKVSFTLKNKNSTTVQTFGTSELLNTISEIYSASVLDELNKVYKKDELSSLEISGYVSNPSYTRSSNKSIYLSVNNRIVKDALVLKTISNIYQNLIPKGKYPLAVLNLNMPSCDVDVNVHPSKKEVKYRIPNQIFNFVYSALNEALSDNNFSINQPEKEEVEVKEEEKNICHTSPIEQTFVQKKEDYIFTPKNFPSYSRTFSSEVHSNEVTTDVAMKLYEKTPDISQQTFDINIVAKQSNDSVKIIGQFNDTFILVENENDLEIIDQHIAQERYIYEKLKQEREISSQGLLFSDVIDLEPVDVQTLKENYEKIKEFGYGIEFLSDREITFRKLPSILAGKDPKQIVLSLIDEIYNAEGSIEEKILISMSCKASVKANTRLLPSQMEDIVKKWRTTKQPMTCPHGRPVSKKIPKSEIASFFLRK